LTQLHQLQETKHTEALGDRD